MTLVQTRFLPRIPALLLFAFGIASCSAGGINDVTANTTGSALPSALATGTAQGALPGHTQLSLRVALSLNNEADLDSQLAAMYDPSSPQYLQFLSNEQFAASYLPTPAQVQQVVSALSAGNITTTATQGTLLTVTGAAQDIAAFFNTTLTTYVGADGNAYYGPSAAVTIPAGLPIAAVHGLYTPAPRTAQYVWAESSAAQALDPEARRHPNPTPTPAQAATFNAATLRTAYNIPATATGAGQTLALLELDGYTPSDIATYVKNNNLTAVPLKNILVNGFNGQVHSADAEVEVALDIELMNAMAPQATQIEVFEAANAGPSTVDILNEMANPTQGETMPTQISSSWGLAEDLSTAAELNSEGTIFKQMAAQGQSFFAASGDFGAFDDGRRLSVDDPASQPYVIGAGGTTLTLNANGTYGSEAAWVDGGGGISAVHAISTWQKALVNSASGASSTMRNVPDVSLNANPATGYIIVAGGQEGQVGGTSCAAPLWAGFLSLVNQQRASAGKSPTGFVAPALYSVGAANGATDFHDITTGNNGHFNAVTGYDDATGIGTLNGAALLNALAK